MEIKLSDGRAIQVRSILWSEHRQIVKASLPEDEIAERIAAICSGMTDEEFGRLPLKDAISLIRASLEASGIRANPTSPNQSEAG